MRLRALAAAAAMTASACSSFAMPTPTPLGLYQAGSMIMTVDGSQEVYNASITHQETAGGILLQMTGRRPVEFAISVPTPPPGPTPVDPGRTARLFSFATSQTARLESTVSVEARIGDFIRQTVSAKVAHTKTGGDGKPLRTLQQDNASAIFTVLRKQDLQRANGTAAHLYEVNSRVFASDGNSTAYVIDFDFFPTRDQP